MALHVLFNQKLSGVAVHGSEPLGGALMCPPTAFNPAVSKLLNFIPEGFNAFSSQTGSQHHVGWSARWWQWQEVQSLGIRGGRKLTCFDLIAVAFVHKKDVAHLDHATLDALHVVAGPSNQGQHEYVDHVSHGDFALADTYGFHQNQVKASRFTKLDGFGGRPGDAAQSA